MPRVGYPAVAVQQKRGKKRSKDKHYSRWNMQGQTTMPCYQEIYVRFDRDMEGDESGSRARREIEQTVKNQADQHFEGCRKCKEYMESRKK